MSAADIKKEEYTPRLLVFYRDEIIPKMKSEFGYKNGLAVPRLVKIVINMGVGVATTDVKLIEAAAEQLALIAGQKAKICRANKPISNFKLKKGVPIGCCVTLRKYRMYEFLDRLITVAIPRIRDFRGFSLRSFDGRGNYTIGLAEQNIFTELNLDRVTRVQGMNISFHTNAGNDEEARQLLRFFGFPFRR
ncbi:MAG: 50S ribosomal protein L5 [Candidatus Omnitrophota bacterium]|nr:MAG: 50S ribosomal protein L5 [Candidatus Omnitrophota bacterium]